MIRKYAVFVHFVFARAALCSSSPARSNEQISKIKHMCIWTRANHSQSLTIAIGAVLQNAVESRIGMRRVERRQLFGKLVAKLLIELRADRFVHLIVILRRVLLQLARNGRLRHNEHVALDECRSVRRIGDNWRTKGRLERRARHSVDFGSEDFLHSLRQLFCRDSVGALEKAAHDDNAVADGRVLVDVVNQQFG